MTINYFAVTQEYCDDCRRLTSSRCWKHGFYQTNDYGIRQCECGEFIEQRFNYCPECGKRKWDLTRMAKLYCKKQMKKFKPVMVDCKIFGCKIKSCKALHFMSYKDFKKKAK